jgi:hypothetical protein
MEFPRTNTPAMDKKQKKKKLVEKNVPFINQSEDSIHKKIVERLKHP